MITYYNWSATIPDEEEIMVSINYYGQVTSTGPGFAIITGTYTLNQRVKVIISLTITE